MKSIIAKVAIAATMLLFSHSLWAQCSGGTSAGSITPTTTFQTVSITSNTYRSFSAVAGNSYIFTFCQGGGSAAFDTQITILNNSGAFAGGYNDDNCGTRSEVSWTCVTTGTYRVLVNTYFCSTLANVGTLAYRSFVPGPGATCGNPHIISALPFTANGLTTCGAGNDYTSLTSCGSSYLNGEDYVFRYVASSAQTIRITLSNTLGYTGIFVYQGCPDTGACISPASGSGCSSSGASNTSSSGNPSADFALPGAGTYYFIVDTWPSPACTGFDINVQAIPSSSGGPGCGTYALSTPAYNPDNFNTGTSLIFPDDEFSALVPIPFTFCFMGVNYNSVVVSSNAYLSFNTACAGQYSGWNTDVIPAPANANSPEAVNSIMFPWVDVDPGVGGTIKYNVAGTAPNRRFVVSFRNVPMFSSTCNSMTYTGQVMLYETSFIIDIYIANLPNCPSWNNGEAVLGLLDASGTVAVPVPGYNNTVYTLSIFARRFTPNCPTCSVLPLHFVDVTGTYQQDHNLVSWSTTHEVNTATFSLQRSRDGSNFETVETVTAAGNDPLGRSYAVEDRGRYPGNNYYRVVERDQNGQEQVSEIILVAANPMGFGIQAAYVEQEMLQITFQNSGDAKAFQLEVLSMVGQVLEQMELRVESGKVFLEMPVGQLSAGVYNLRIRDGKGNADNRKFVKQ